MKCTLFRSVASFLPLLAGLLLSASSVQLPAQTPSKPSATAASASSAGNEILKVNDLVRVSVYKEDDMLTETRISKSGDIALPLLGSVHVAGQTVAEAAADIRAKLDKDYIINPQVTLTIMEYAPQWVTVLGEVQRAGQVAIPPQGGLDLMGAIALAGGYTRIADPSKITVRRGGTVLRVDARKLAGDSKSAAFLVQPGDTISVGQSVW